MTDNIALSTADGTKWRKTSHILDELTTDSDEYKKKAIKKRKLAAPRKPSPMFLSAAQFHWSDVVNPTPPYTYNQCRNAPSQAKKKNGTIYKKPKQTISGNFKRPTNHCYNCGELSHWKQLHQKEYYPKR